MSEVSVRPATGTCEFDLGLDPAGKRKRCPRKATMKIDNVALCDTHAELAMMTICKRQVKITR